MIHCSKTGEFGDLLFPSSEKSITRFCCVMLAGDGPLRDSYLDYLVGPTLASEYVFDFVDF